MRREFCGVSTSRNSRRISTTIAGESGNRVVIGNERRVSVCQFMLPGLISVKTDNEYAPRHGGGGRRGQDACLQ